MSTPTSTPAPADAPVITAQQWKWSALAGMASYYSRLEQMVSKMLADEGVRLPGARRQRAAAKARAEGIEVSEALLGELQALARGKSK